MLRLAEADFLSHRPPSNVWWKEDLYMEQCERVVLEGVIEVLKEGHLTFRVYFRV